MEWSNNRTQGHWETASKEGTTGETSASAGSGELDSVSGVEEPVIQTPLPRRKGSLSIG